MTPEIFLLLSTVVVGLVLFALELVPTDVTALGILLFLTIAGLLPVERAFAGFGSDAVIMILGILIMKVGIIPSILIYLIAILMVPLLWPLGMP